MARDDLHFRLRIPEALKAQVEKAAQENRRSMTAEIIARLEESFSPKQEGQVQTLYVILDQDGHPSSWDETFEHIRAIRKAGGFHPDVLNAIVYNGPRVSSTLREEKAEEIARWHRRYVKTHPLSPQSPEIPTTRGTDD